MSRRRKEENQNKDYTLTLELIRESFGKDIVIALEERISDGIKHTKITSKDIWLRNYLCDDILICFENSNGGIGREVAGNIMDKIFIEKHRAEPLYKRLYDRFCIKGITMIKKQEQHIRNKLIFSQFMSERGYPWNEYNYLSSEEEVKFKKYDKNLGDEFKNQLEVILENRLMPILEKEEPWLFRDMINLHQMEVVKTLTVITVICLDIYKYDPLGLDGVRMLLKEYLIDAGEENDVIYLKDLYMIIIKELSWKYVNIEYDEKRIVYKHKDETNHEDVMRFFFDPETITALGIKKEQYEEIVSGIVREGSNTEDSIYYFSKCIDDKWEVLRGYIKNRLFIGRSVDLYVKDYDKPPKCIEDICHYNIPLMPVLECLRKLVQRLVVQRIPEFDVEIEIPTTCVIDLILGLAMLSISRIKKEDKKEQDPKIQIIKLNLRNKTIGIIERILGIEENSERQNDNENKYLQIMDEIKDYFNESEETSKTFQEWINLNRENTNETSEYKYSNMELFPEWLFPRVKDTYDNIVHRIDVIRPTYLPNYEFGLKAVDAEMERVSSKNKQIAISDWDYIKNLWQNHLMEISDDMKNSVKEFSDTYRRYTETLDNDDWKKFINATESYIREMVESGNLFIAWYLLDLVRSLKNGNSKTIYNRPAILLGEYF